MAVNRQLAGWTIFDHPDDYPEHYVARQWFLKRERGESLTVYTDEVLLSKSLDVVRDALMSKGLEPVDRSPEDAPAIVETWR